MKKISLEECKKIMLETLAYFDEICRKNNINYTLIGGTLIGAIRHKGIIPWDDDIDVALTREDYNKIISILEQDDNHQYKVITWQNNKDYYYPFAKLVDTRTYLQERDYKMYDDCGLYIDLFPYDIAPKRFIKLHYFRKKILNTFIHGLAFNPESCNQNNYFIKKIRAFISNKILGKKRILKHYDHLCMKYNNKDYDGLMSPFMNRVPKIIKKDDMNEFIYTEFDGYKFQIVKNYDGVLKEYFGDYMKLPPENQRVTHGLTVYWKEKQK